MLTKIERRTYCKKKTKTKRWKKPTTTKQRKEATTKNLCNCYFNNDAVKIKKKMHRENKTSGI